MQSYIHQLFANKEVLMSWTQLRCIQHTRPRFCKQLSNEPNFSKLVFGKNVLIREILVNRDSQRLSTITYLHPDV